MDAETVQRFRFATDYGEVYAVAVPAKGSGLWGVAFACCSPMDRGKLRKAKGRIAGDITAGRLCTDNATGRLMVVYGLDRGELRESIVERLLSATAHENPQKVLGLKEYSGVGGGDFARWFTGKKFADQFRERYAGGDV